ncbi:MAG: valine--tRNA ligase, partial [Candidatus Nanohaloarchaeota archaeon]|nr:valine--tRNA ligase [Candidatus Nanohaloarchaeota archaeon]
MGEPKLKDKRWNKDWEIDIAEEWRNNKAYKFNKNTKKKIYSIDTPPPYVNAPVHMGHATTYTLMDMFARFRRLVGYEVLFPLGMDRNGLPIEIAAEKKYGIIPSQHNREEFLNKCKELLEEFSTKSAETFFRLGISFNSWDVGTKIGDLYLTDMDEYRALTQYTFMVLWKKGLIYEDERINNYCPKLKTTIADSEISYIEKETFLNYITFKVKETGEEIVVGTTRPELLGACKAIIFNPQDERYKHLEGKHAIVPLYNREIKIMAHPYAKKEFGTGLVMMCSFGDYADVRFFREQNLKPLILINEEGRMNEKAGKELEGLKVEDARKKIIEMLKEAGYLVKQEKIKHKVPVNERTKTPIEFIAMKELYLKQVEFKEEIRRISRNIKFFSEESRKILEQWIDNISIDWPISRRRYYATEIPLWYCKKCGHAMVPEPNASKLTYYQPWKENPPFEKCEKCGGKEFIGETRVFDTWFDSSITPLFIGGYVRDHKFFTDKLNERITLRPQGKDIIRTWLYYTLLRVYQLTGREAFEHVWINHHVLDEKGNKMSKSLGNVIDPQEIIKKYGAEPFRLWCAFEGNMHKGDFRVSYERIEGAGKFLTKLWNVSRFISSFEIVEDQPEKLTETDKAFLVKLNELIKDTYYHYMRYEVHDAAVKIRDFVWDVFASHYIELVKSRAYNSYGKYTEEEQKSALYVLHKALQAILIMIHPVVPFATYKIMKEIYNKNILKENYPEIIDISTEVDFEKIMEINSAIWKFKKDHGLSLKSSLKQAVLPSYLSEVFNDLKVMHNIEEIKEGKEI